MRKDIVLATAVLSVTAGLLTVGHAQNRDDDGPDAFELRRQLIDRIEDSVTRNDLPTLQRMSSCADLPALDALALTVWPENPEQSAMQTDDELQSVTSAILPWILRLIGAGGQLSMCRGMLNDAQRQCEIDQDTCRSAASGAVEGQVWSGMPHGECAEEYSACMQEAGRVFNVCMSQPPPHG